MKLRIIAIATVMTLGIGGAVVASNNMQTANVQNVAGENQEPVWETITPGHKGCDDDSERACLGYRETPTSTVIELAFGNENP